MTQYQITLNEQTLQRLFGADSHLASLVEAMLNQVLNAQASEQLHAERYERTDERQGYRNGYKSRQLTTRVGTLTLRVPQVREGIFSTDLFARYQRSEQALILTLMELVVNGVSTRKVAHITAELCGREFAKSTVSDLCKGLDPLVEAWNGRELGGTRYPFVLVDALVIKVRESGRVRARSALIATGVNEDGYREMLGLQLGDSESERSWGDFFTWLKGRGLHGVDLVVSDHHGGLVSQPKPAGGSSASRTWGCISLSRCRPPSQEKGSVSVRSHHILRPQAIRISQILFHRPSRWWSTRWLGVGRACSALSATTCSQRSTFLLLGEPVRATRADPQARAFHRRVLSTP